MNNEFNIRKALLERCGDEVAAGSTPKNPNFPSSNSSTKTSMTWTGGLRNVVVEHLRLQGALGPTLALYKSLHLAHSFADAYPVSPHHPIIAARYEDAGP